MTRGCPSRECAANVERSRSPPLCEKRASAGANGRGCDDFVHQVHGRRCDGRRVTAARAAPPAETAEQAKRRHERVAERRKGTDIICHRGASEHAHENTLEAFRATFELGGDGNEFDIRATKDGVLVVFHDDMLDRLLEAYGDVSDYTWEELQTLPVPQPRPVRRAVPHPDAGRGVRPAPQARRADAPGHQAARARRAPSPTCSRGWTCGTTSATATRTPAG